MDDPTSFLLFLFPPTFGEVRPTRAGLVVKGSEGGGRVGGWVGGWMILPPSSSCSSFSHPLLERYALHARVWWSRAAEGLGGWVASRLNCA